MRKYRNTRTGLVVHTKGIVSGENWEPVEEPVEETVVGQNAASEENAANDSQPAAEKDAPKRSQTRKTK